MNYRNTIEILDFAYRFASTYLDQPSSAEEIPLIRPEFGGKNGIKPEVRYLTNPAQELEYLASWLKNQINSGIPLHQIAVLCRFKKQAESIQTALAKKGIAADSSQSNGKWSKSFEPSADTIKILTMHASKGLEFISVAIPDLGCMPFIKATVAEEARLLYVALTRSTENMLITYHKKSIFTQQCEKNYSFSCNS